MQADTKTQLNTTLI